MRGFTYNIFSVAADERTLKQERQGVRARLTPFFCCYNNKKMYKKFQKSVDKTQNNVYNKYIKK